MCDLGAKHDFDIWAFKVFFLNGELRTQFLDCPEFVLEFAILVLNIRTKMVFVPHLNSFFPEHLFHGEHLNGIFQNTFGCGSVFGVRMALGHT